jgi:hypothetical protein
MTEMPGVRNVRKPVKTDAKTLSRITNQLLYLAKPSAAELAETRA